MSRQAFRIGSWMLALALTAPSAWAQHSRPAGSEATGSATPRGGDGGNRGGGGGGGATSNGGGGGASNSGGMVGGGGSTSSSSSSSAAAPAGMADPAPMLTAPRHPSERRSEYSADQGRRNPQSGSRGGERAVPRGSSGSGGNSGGNSGSTGSAATTRSRSAGSSSSSERADASAPERRAVPANSRPRNGQPVRGEAVPRSTPIYGGGGSIIYYPYYPYYGYPYGYYGSYGYPYGYYGGYGFGLGFGFYDPFWYSGYSSGYYDPSYGYGSGSFYGGSGGYGQSNGRAETGSLRLKIKPRQAQVFVDGYLVGVVDSFDGTFQRLDVDSGRHKIELKADGYEPLEFEALVAPGETATYKGDMKRIK